MAEANSVLGQTYNANQQKVYPYVVPQSFVLDSTFEDTPTDMFDNIIRNTINKFDVLSPKKLSFGKNGGIDVITDTSARSFLSVNPDGDIQFESEHISDKIGDNGKCVKFSFDNSDKVIIDASKLTINHPITITKPVISTSSDSELTAGTITTRTISVHNSSSVLKQYSELPEPSSEYAEDVIQYVGPTHHFMDDGIRKYDFLKCVVGYEITEHPDSSSYIVLDETSFEPFTTLSWLLNNDIKHTTGNVYTFKVHKDNNDGRFYVYVDKTNGDTIYLGPEEIYAEGKWTDLYRYCPYVWDTEYEPLGDITYKIKFYPDNYAWKPIY